jgi:O-antigen/teichoic acid export membrane protein
LKRGPKDLTTSRAELRSRRIKLAVITSVGSKVASVAVQAIALPVAVKALGPDHFGVYAVVAATLSWITISNLGVGPGLTMGIATAVANDDRETEARYLVTAHWLLGAMSLVLLLGVLVFWRFHSVHTILGEKYAPYAAEVREGFLWLGIILALTTFTSVAEATRAGYQEQHITNLYGLLGNALSVVGLLLVSDLWPTVTGMILCIYGAPLVGRSLNGMHLVWEKRSILLPNWRHFDRVVTKNILQVGFAFCIMQTGAFVCQQFIIIIAGRLLGPRDVSSFAVMMQATILGGGVVTMFTRPFWPAIIDALERKDFTWVRNAYPRALRIAMAYAICIGACIALAGHTIITLWIGPESAPSLLLQISMGVYFTLAIWEYVHFIILMGMKRILPSSIALFIRSLVAIAATFIFAPYLAGAGAGLALCLSVATVTMWFLPVLLRQTTRELRLDEADTTLQGAHE